MTKENGPPSISSLDTLGVTGVAAFFDSLGLGAYTNQIRRRKKSLTTCDGEGGGGGGGESPGSMAGIDGAELARIAHASDPDAELLEMGVSARLHRVKLLVALGVRPAGAVDKTVAPPRDADADLASVSCAPPTTPIAAKAALFMVQSIRREQEAMDEALRSVAQVQAVVDPLNTEEWSRFVGREEEEEKGGSYGQGGVTGMVVGSGDNDESQKKESSVGSGNHSPVACKSEWAGTSPASGLVTNTGGNIRPIDGGRVLDGVQSAVVVAERRRTAASAGEGGLVSMPLRLLPELEQALSAQVRLSSQVKKKNTQPCITSYDTLLFAACYRLS